MQNAPHLDMNIKTSQSDILPLDQIWHLNHILSSGE